MNKGTPITDAIEIDHLTATEREYKLRKLCRNLEQIANDAFNSFSCTQRSSYYGRDHWSNRLEALKSAVASES